MKQRINAFEKSTGALQALRPLGSYLAKSSIERSLLNLIQYRVSQINGCAFCLNMHSADARKMGETEKRIYCISAWRECTFYTDAEKGALELTEYVTLIPTKRVPDELYQRVRDHFDEKQYVDLILIINQINNWNRISISMGNIATEK